jgi:electron transport complex protein RnfG
MTKLRSSFRNMLLSLGSICILSGGILATVNHLTLQPIAASKKNKLEKALKAILPEFDNNPAEESRRVALAENDSLPIYPAMKNGKWVGSAVESNSMKGFSGEIRIIAGFDNRGTLINYKVLAHTETPGLGSQMEQWFRTNKNRQSVIGKNLSTGGALKLAKDKGEIDAITGATISSRAFLDALNRAYAAYAGEERTDATSSASSASHNEKDPQ